MNKLLTLLLLLVSGCSFGQFPLMLSGSVESSIVYTAKNGEGTFTMTEIPNETVELYSYWNIPAKGNLTLLVFIHGWDGDGRYDPGTTVMNYLHDNDIGFLSVGMRGRNTGGGPTYPNVDVDVLKYRDAGAKEAYDVYATINHFLATVPQVGQINTDKITLYGISGGGGTAYAVASKFPDMFNIVVDWYGMNKYGAYTGDPTKDTHVGWAQTNSFYRGGDGPIDGWPDGIQGAVAYTDYYGAGYSAGIGDAAYAARDHYQAMKNFTGKTYMYHYSGDTFVSVAQSDYMDSKMTSDGQTHSFQRSTSILLYDHGNFDLSPDYFDPVTPYGLHWVDDAKTLTKQSFPSTGSIDYIAGFIYFNDVELWAKRYRENNAGIGAYRTNQGTHHAFSLSDYNLSTNVFEFTALTHNATEPYHYISLKRGSKELEFLIIEDDILTVNLKEYNRQPLDYSHSCKLYYDFRNSDGNVLDQNDKVSNIIDLSGNGYTSWQGPLARSVVTSGGIEDPNYYFATPSGTLATQALIPSLTGEFTIIVDVDATTVGLDKDILGGGSNNNFIEVFGNDLGHLVFAIQTSAGQYANNDGSTGSTSNGTGRRVYCIRKTSGGEIHMSHLGADGYFNGGNRGTDSGTFEIRFIGGRNGSNTWDGKFKKLAVYDEDIGDTDAHAIMDDFYAN